MNERPVIAMFVRNLFKHDARVTREAMTMIEQGFDVRVFAVAATEEDAGDVMQGDIRVVRMTLGTPVSRFASAMLSANRVYYRIASFPRRTFLKKLRLWRRRSIRAVVRAWFVLRLPPKDTRRFASERGPAALVIWVLIAPIQAIVRRRYRLPAGTELAPPNWKAPAKRPPRTVPSVNAARLRFRNATWPAHRFLQGILFGKVAGARAAALRPVAYHCHDLNTILAAHYARKIHRAPFIYDSHELWPHRNRPDARKRKTFLVEQGDRLWARRADAVITVNESIAHHIEKRYGVREVTVLRNTPSIAVRHVDGATGVLDGVARPLLMYVGGIQTHRGIEELIDAMTMIPNGTLVAMGPGNDKYRATLAARAEAIGVTDRVLFTGIIPHDRLVATIAQGDLGFALIKNYCLSYYLSLPNKFFEYLHAGLPVIASNFPEMRALVERYEVGATTDPANAEEIARVTNDLLARPDDLARFRENARKAAEDVNWEHEREQLIGLYRRILGPRTTQP